MATEMLQYLDPEGLDETAVNIARIRVELESLISNLETSLKEEMQNLPYARPAGLYPDMTVGTIMSSPQTSQWATRESTGTGSATVRSVQGAAVGWNQGVKAGTGSQTPFGLVLVPSQDTSWAVSGTVSDSPAMPYIDVSTWDAAKRADVFIPNHKYLIKVYDTVASPTKRFAYIAITGAGIGYAEISALNQGIVTITGVPSGVYVRINVDSYKGTTVSGTVAWNIFDLTQMFGSGNEPTTVAEFEAMYPAAYYPYSAPTLKPVQIAGIASTDAQGGELDSVEWPTQTLWGVGDTRDVLTSDAVVHNLNSYTFTGNEPVALTNWRPFEGTYAFALPLSVMPDRQTAAYNKMPIAMMADVQANKYNRLFGDGTDPECGFSVSSDSVDSTYSFFIRVPTSIATNSATLLAWLAGKTIVYAVAEPTTQPISPALPMTYRVQQGGSESIIVPEGEISAAPLITINNPLNVAEELARVWDAIGQLQSRETTQLSRTDIVSVDKTQKDTTEVVEKGNIKEVQE